MFFQFLILQILILLNLQNLILLILLLCIGIFAGIYFTRIFGFLGRKTIFAPLSMEKRRRTGSHPPNLQKKKN